MMKCNGLIRVMCLCLGMLTVWLAACNSGGSGGGLEPTAVTITEEQTADTLPTPTLALSVTEEVPTPTEVPAETVPPTAVPPTATPPSTPADIEQLRQELQTLAFPADTFDDVYAFPLPQDQNSWLVHSVGFRPYETVDNHAAAVYRYEAGQWQELGRLELSTPDILYEEMITAVDLGDGRYWFEEHSFIGAHGSCYELLRYEANALTVEISSCNSSNASNGIGDLNQDGRPDIAISQSIDYVFCYACGVRYPVYEIYEFAEDNTWQLVTVQRLGEDNFPDLRDTNNEAVRLFEMGLYKKAAETINLIVGDVPIVLWNQVIINMYAEDTRFQAQGGPYPFVGQIFYGNYDAALDMMRPYSPAELFSQQTNPLVVGTVAEGWEETLADWVIQITEPVVAGEPGMAAAHFLYAWGLYLADATDARVIGGLETAVALDPNEPLYQESLNYLRSDS